MKHSEPIWRSQAIDMGINTDRAYCANIRCMKPWKNGERRNPLKVCQARGVQIHDVLLSE